MFFFFTERSVKITKSVILTHHSCSPKKKYLSRDERLVMTGTIRTVKKVPLGVQFPIQLEILDGIFPKTSWCGYSENVVAYAVCINKEHITNRLLPLQRRTSIVRLLFDKERREPIIMATFWILIASCGNVCTKDDWFLACSQRMHPRSQIALTQSLYRNLAFKCAGTNVPSARRSYSITNNTVQIHSKDLQCRNIHLLRISFHIVLQTMLG